MQLYCVVSSKVSRWSSDAFLFKIHFHLPEFTCMPDQKCAGLIFSECDKEKRRLLCLLGQTPPSHSGGNVGLPDLNNCFNVSPNRSPKDQLNPT